MPNFFLVQPDGHKQGPISEEQLKTLASNGDVTPTTLMETDTGHKGVAGQIPGLTFKVNVPAVIGNTRQDVFCTNCGNPISEQAVACMGCGAKPTGHRRFCRHCAAHLGPEQIICTKCGAGITTAGSSRSVGGSIVPGEKNKIAAGILAIMFGGIGVHKFYMGSWGWGLAFLVNLLLFLPFTIALSVVSFGLLSFLTGLPFMFQVIQFVIGLVEGIIYLTMSDEAFAAKYPPETQSAFRW